MIEIPSKPKYRISGGWPKSQASPGTANGGDAHLEKNKRKRKLSKTGPRQYIYDEQHAKSQAGMRKLRITADGKRRWV